MGNVSVSLASVVGQAPLTAARSGHALSFFVKCAQPGPGLAAPSPLRAAPAPVPVGSPSSTSLSAVTWRLHGPDTAGA